MSLLTSTATVFGSGPHSGFVLVAVLVLVMLVSMVAVSLMFYLRAEETATAAGIGSEQAWAAAMSGVHEAMRVALSISPGSLDWQDSPETFRDRFVFDDGSDRWYFSIFSGGDSERQTVRSGLTDEASKLSLTNATEVMLSKFPGITPYLAQGLLDFQDADNTPRPEGAEQEYYDSLARPYSAFNRPVSTLGELLLVRGITPAVLHGEDANQNNQLDMNEDDGDTQFPLDNKDGRLDYGLREYMTVSSYDLNRASDGTSRININAPEQAVPETDFPAALTRYLAALRRSNVKITHPADLLEAKAKLKDENGQEVDLASGVGKAELAVVLDRFTAKSEPELPGLININTATARVLQTLEGIDETLAEQIVSARRTLNPEQRRTPAWLFEEGLVDTALFKKVAPYLTARSYQFHFQVIGFAVPSGRYRVLEAIIDVAGSTPVISYLRDITRLGLPFRVDAIKEGDELGSSRSPRGTDLRSLGGISGNRAERLTGRNADLQSISIGRNRRGLRNSRRARRSARAAIGRKRCSSASGSELHRGARPSRPQQAHPEAAVGKVSSVTTFWSRCGLEGRAPKSSQSATFLRDTDRLKICATKEKRHA